MEEVVWLRADEESEAFVASRRADPERSDQGDTIIAAIALTS